MKIVHDDAPVDTLANKQSFSSKTVVQLEADRQVTVDNPLLRTKKRALMPIMDALGSDADGPAAVSATAETFDAVARAPSQHSLQRRSLDSSRGSYRSAFRVAAPPTLVDASSRGAMASTRSMAAWMKPAASRFAAGAAALRKPRSEFAATSGVGDRTARPLPPAAAVSKE